MAQLQNPRRRVVAINASNGAAVIIAPTGPCRKMTITECPPSGGSFTGSNYAPQGLNYQRADEAYANTYGVVPGDTIVLGSTDYPRDKALGVPFNATDPAGNPIGSIAGSQSPQAALKVISATTTATQIEVDEWI